MAKAKRKTAIPRSVVATAWSGIMRRNILGWQIPVIISPGENDMWPVQEDLLNKKEPFYKVKITIEPVLDKDGNPIVRRCK